MAVINGFSNDDNGFNSRCINKRRRFEKYDKKPIGEDFPFKIERIPTDCDEYYRGICKGARVVYEMWKSGLFEDGSYAVTYFAKENVGPCFLDDCEDDYFELFEDDVYEAGFDDGFRQGYQSACEEVKADIYVDTEKVCKIDQLQNEILELGKKLHPADIDMLNAILTRVIDLKYQVGKDAIDEYLGYK